MGLFFQRNFRFFLPQIGVRPQGVQLRLCINQAAALSKILEITKKFIKRK